ncbi:cytochrome P450 [Sphingomonas sp. M1-B02]|uniref:cytochrome P450 n=1 Tax=Sphingomonas sp. M1-B02 TaxID=3114300 RepID=UPI00223F89DF|nr:cytochrome P450 [Sphingomonas sp. S6-11]UZK64631.1 cytochrome P450 [Sphingomonas sp. S6-11]
MSALSSRDVLRPGPKGIKAWIQRLVFAAMPWFFSLLRRVKPVAKLSGMVLTSRYDDVREVFATDAAFGVVYKPKLDVIMGGQPFFLGMHDTPQYHADVAAMRKVVLPADLPMLAVQTEALAATIVDRAPGRIDVVDTLVRRVTFTVLSDYLGVPEPAGGDLRVWATRLFEFQFADGGNDPKLRADVDEIAPALRAHIQDEIDRRRADPGKDDVLARSLAMQAAGEPGYSDDQIRTSLMGFIVGGPPQPPMVVPQAMEQLLRRPAALAEAQAAARAGDDERLRRYVYEAMRFDPLAPGLPREVLTDWTIAKGTRHATTIPKGATVLAAFASAMMDPRRVANPRVFDPDRPASDYIHFGYGLHECFGRHINHATLHLMLKPLLVRPNLRRAAGAEGRLSKNGAFAERLVVEFD